MRIHRGKHVQIITAGKYVLAATTKLSYTVDGEQYVLLKLDRRVPARRARRAWRSSSAQRERAQPDQMIWIGWAMVWPGQSPFGYEHALERLDEILDEVARDAFRDGPPPAAGRSAESAPMAPRVRRHDGVRRAPEPIRSRRPAPVGRGRGSALRGRPPAARGTSE